jgi:hypothetical protein
MYSGQDFLDQGNVLRGVAKGGAGGAAPPPPPPPHPLATPLAMPVRGLGRHWLWGN